MNYRTVKPPRMKYAEGGSPQQASPEQQAAMQIMEIFQQLSPETQAQLLEMMMQASQQQTAPQQAPPQQVDPNMQETMERGGFKMY